MKGGRESQWGARILGGSTSSTRRVSTLDGSGCQGGLIRCSWASGRRARGKGQGQGRGRGRQQERCRQRRKTAVCSCVAQIKQACIVLLFPAARCRFFILVLVADSCCCRGVRARLGDGGRGSPRHLAETGGQTVTMGPGQLDTKSHQNCDPGGLIWCLPSVARKVVDFQTLTPALSAHSQRRTLQRTGPSEGITNAHGGV